MIAIAHHKPVTVGVELVGELLQVSGDLSVERRGQHLAVPITDDLIEQQLMFGVIGLLGVLNYGEHGRAFPTSAATPASTRDTGLSDHPREGAPTITPPLRDSSTRSDHCSPMDWIMRSFGWWVPGQLEEHPRGGHTDVVGMVGGSFIGSAQERVTRYMKLCCKDGRRGLLR